MSRFKKYLNEGRSKNVAEDQAIDLLKKNCKRFLQDLKRDKKPYIYRGFNNDDDFLFVDPTKGEPRKSANTENYYTLIIDNSELWKDYPKRSKSLICSTNKGTASNYGDVYFVIPYDKAKIGVCPASDFWDGFDNTVTDGLSVLNNEIQKIVNLVTGIKQFDNNFNDLKNALNKTSEMLNEVAEKIWRKDISDNEKRNNWYEYLDVILNYPYKDSDPFNYLLNTFNSNKEIDLLDWLQNDILVPDENGFTTKLKSNKLKNEVWIGNAPCILIHRRFENILEDILNEI